MPIKHYLFLVFTGLFVCISCSDDEPASNCEDVDLLVDFETEQDAIAEAQINHLLVSSDENCRILKDALNDYLMQLEQFENCERSASEEEQYQEALNNIQEDLDNLTC